MLEIGATAPEFSLTDDSGNTVTLHGLLKEGPILLYFYPGDFTPVCTKQACMFRDIHLDMATAGVKVIGVSPDGAASHAKFRKDYSLPFPLLADPAKKVIGAYGATGPFGIGVRRVSYLIGQDGRVEKALVADLRVGKHEEFAREAAHETKPGH